MAASAPKPLETLIDEVRLLWNAMVRAGEQLHAGEPVTMGMRAVLEFLARNGPTSVPNIARSRRVTRQHIQALVNALSDAGCVVLEENPQHKRSPLVALSKQGERMIARMKRREASVLAGASAGMSGAQLERAAKTLRALREGLED